MPGTLWRYMEKDIYISNDKANKSVFNKTHQGVFIDLSAVKFLVGKKWDTFMTEHCVT